MFRSVLMISVLVGLVVLPSAPAMAIKAPKPENKPDTIVIKAGPLIIRDPGNYDAPKGECPIEIKASEAGDFLQLTLPPSKDQVNVINDVTGAAYVGGQRLVYSVSPINGDPGVYVFDCMAKKISEIAKPKNANDAYPTGADYFELQEVGSKRVLFYYSTDVDDIDFENFRKKENLFEVNIAGGSAFKKAM